MSNRLSLPVSDPLETSTLPPSTITHPGDAAPPLETPALVLLWSRREPRRVAEVLLVPTGDRLPWTFGRGEGLSDERRLSLVRQRPHALVPTGPLTSPNISRAQLRLTVLPEVGLVIENIGACKMLHEGVEVTRAEVKPGDTLALRNELLFLCVQRSLPLGPRLEPDEPAHVFGEVDPFGLVGESTAIWQLRKQVASIAQQAFHVLILGESGSGKELVARAIHQLSARNRRPMVSRNAATIPEGLADAELFGSSRNYPNAGMPERPGLIGEAHHSTLFLDEFAELSFPLQSHLLRVLDEGEYQRLGDATRRHSDLRVLAATNRAPTEIKHDVLARFKVHVSTPGLNGRREDIPLLATHLLRCHAHSDPSIIRRFFEPAEPSGVPRISPVLLEALVKHTYVTHVRELETLLIRSTLGSRGRHLELTPELRDLLSVKSVPSAADDPLKDLSRVEQLRLSLLRRHSFSPTACARDAAYPGNRQTADLHLRQLMCHVLERADWNVPVAATLLAGQAGPDLLSKSCDRLATFVANLAARVAQQSEAELLQGLQSEWRGHSEVVFKLVSAIRAGRVITA